VNSRVNNIYIDSHYIGIILRAFIFKDNNEIYNYFDLNQNKQLESYCNTVKFYLNYYICLITKYLGNKVSEDMLNRNLLEFFNTNYIKLDPNFFSNKVLISKRNYQHLLSAIEMGSEKLIEL
jgi:hypothetical protein